MQICKSKLEIAQNMKIIGGRLAFDCSLKVCIKQIPSRFHGMNTSKPNCVDHFQQKQ